MGRASGGATETHTDNLLSGLDEVLATECPQMQGRRSEPGKKVSAVVVAWSSTACGRGAQCDM